MEEPTTGEWQVIVGPGPRQLTEAAWEAWLAEHDVSDLGADAIRSDIGRSGDGRDFRRYMIRKSALQSIRPPVDLDRDY